MVFADLRSEHAFFYLRVFRAESFYKVSEMDLWRFAYELIDLRFFRVIMKSYLGSTQKSCGSSKRQAAYP
jgi:hypothetical protein